MLHLGPVSRLLLLVAVVGIGACGDDGTTSPTTTSATELRSDGEILHVARTLDQGEVGTSQPAATRAMSDSVKKFAQMMITHHTAAMARTDSMATASGATLTANAVSGTLQTTALGIATKLNGMNGAAFDREYMEVQLTLHSNALNMLDFTLIPKAANAQVKALLAEKRATVAMHLAMARGILSGLI